MNLKKLTEGVIMSIEKNIAIIHPTGKNRIELKRKMNVLKNKSTGV